MICEGWKYFQLKNLNELFAIMYQKYGTIDAEAPASDEVENAPSEEGHPNIEALTLGNETLSVVSPVKNKTA